MRVEKMKVENVAQSGRAGAEIAVSQVRILPFSQSTDKLGMGAQLLNLSRRDENNHRNDSMVISSGG